MADTTFTNGVTLTDADWFNDVNRLHYTIFGDPANLAAVRTTLAASDTEKGTIEIAVQSEIEAGSSNTLAVTPGRQQYHPSAAKAWAFITWSGGTPTLTAGYNISGSLTDNGAGDVTMNFTTNMSSANYAVVATPFDNGGFYVPLVFDKSTSAVRIKIGNLSGTATDIAGVFVVMYGDQ